jgi:pantothenate synthetase
MEGGKLDQAILMVGTIVNAFEIVNPTNAYFGEKDYHY